MSPYEFSSDTPEWDGSSDTATNGFLMPEEIQAAIGNLPLRDLSKELAKLEREEQREQKEAEAKKNGGKKGASVRKRK